MEGPAAKAEMEGRAAKAEVKGPAVESTIDRGQRQAQGQEPWHGTCAASAMTVPLVCEEFSPRGCDNKARLQPTATQTSPRSRATKQSKNWSPWGGGVLAEQKPTLELGGWEVLALAQHCVARPRLAR